MLLTLLLVTSWIGVMVVCPVDCVFDFCYNVLDMMITKGVDIHG